MPDAIDRALDLKLWTVLVRANAAVEAHAYADLARRQFTPGEFGVLEALYHKGPMLIGEVQRRVLKSSGGLSFVLDKLEGRALIERRPVLDDARARLVLLTRAGRQLIAAAFPAHAAVISRALSGLSLEQKEEAVRLLRTLGHAAAALAIEPPARAS